jgi:hypothetical protein
MMQSVNLWHFSCVLVSELRITSSQLFFRGKLNLEAVLGALSGEG